MTVALATQDTGLWLAHYPPGVSAQLEYPTTPAWGFLQEAAADYPRRIASLYYEQEITYAQLWKAACRAASGLVAAGLKPGDRVGVLLPNCPEFLISVYGIWLAHGVVVSLSPLMVAEEAGGLLRATACRTVVTLDVLASRVGHEAGPLRQVWLVSLADRMAYWERLGYGWARITRGGWSRRDGCTQASFSRLLAEGSPEPPRTPDEDELDDPAYVLGTGGTTAAPKAVVLTHRNLMSNAWQLAHWAGFPSGTETILAVLPFFHSFGLTTCVTTGVALAATLVMDHRFQPRRVLQLIERRRPTLFFAVPTMLAKLNECLAVEPADVSSVRWCVSGGAALEPQIAEEFAAHTGGLVVEGYGLSEAGPVTHANPLDGTARPGSIGLPLPDTDAKIVDFKTGRRTLPLGEVGELLVRGPQVMAGYWSNPEETNRVLQEGWLYTGDLATCDEDGFFRIVGRKKELIITSGFNVYPTDVEDVLRRYPGVADVAVVGVPHPQRGEVVKAALVLNKGHRFSRRAFNYFVRQHLSKHKRPQVVEIVADLPRNFLGKVLRRRLREDGPDALKIEEGRNMLSMPLIDEEAALDTSRKTEREPLAVLTGVRTPLAKAFGALAGVPADELGRIAVERLLAGHGDQPADVEEVVFGNVAGPPEASNVARVIAIRAGVPLDRIAHTVNRNCASGIEAVVAAWQAIAEKRAELILAGGTESMSSVPLLWDPRMKQWLVRWRRERRWWAKLALLAELRPSFFRPVPGLELGLTDPTCGLKMGETAELLAREFSISRASQDSFALRSHERALAAWERGFFRGEVISLSADETGGKPLERDTGPRPGLTLEALAKLPPVFERGGTVTVGNSCAVTDGAVALLVASMRRAQVLEAEPLGYVRDYAVAGCDPRRMGMGPVFAISKLLQQTGRSLEDFDLVEINESFAAQVLACAKAMGSDRFAREHLGREQALGELDPERLNVNGGAIALGHPIGATGARLVLTLLRALRERGLRDGLASLCVGGGQGAAVWVQTSLKE